MLSSLLNSKNDDIFEDNHAVALNTAVIVSEKLVKNCLLHNIKNLIALSTDKTIAQSNIYGHSKLMMRNIVLKNEYSVYLGANLIWSNGSLLKFWVNQMQEEKKTFTFTELINIRFLIALIMSQS